MKTIDKIAAETNALISELAVLMIGTVNDRARQLKFNAVHVKAEALKKDAQAITEILKTAYTVTPVLKEEVAAETVSEEVVSVADPDKSESPEKLTDPMPVIKKVKLDKSTKEHKGSKKAE